MSLIKIESPSKSKTPRAIGIDLGTTHSLVAYDREGAIEILTDEMGNALLPSVVRYGAKGEVIVGEEAISGFSCSPENTISSVKRLMGSSAECIQTTHKKVTPVEVSAEILKKLFSIAHCADNSIDSAVITVPAYFDDTQRQATKDAAKLAGIKVLRLLNEPTAAAIAYGLDSGAKGKCFIFDMGGGTFDVSLLELNEGVFEVIATGGDTALGGDDMDYLIAQWFLDKTNTIGSEINFSELRYLVRQAKEALTTQSAVEINFAHKTLPFTREFFNELITPLIQRTLSACELVLTDAKIAREEIDQVVLVGGATRIPYLQQQVERFFKQAPLKNIDPDKVVAIGAGIQASILSGQRTDLNVLLLDVLPLSLGIEMMGGVVEKLLLRNTPVPAQITSTFTTYEDGQTGFLLQVVQGERELAKDCRSLARFELSGLPPKPAGQVKLAVTFQVDVDGLLSVAAKEIETGKETHVQVKPTYGLSAERVERLIEEAITHAQVDLTQRKRQEKITSAERLLTSLEKAVETDGDLLGAKEKESLLKEMATLKSAMANSSLVELNAAFQALEKTVHPFMEHRLQATLEKAIVGTTL